LLGGHLGFFLAASRAVIGLCKALASTSQQQARVLGLRLLTYQPP
jgi:hypothetical protein